MESFADYRKYFNYMNNRYIKNHDLTEADYLTVSLHVFDAVFAKKLCTLDVLAEDYPVLLGRVKKNYEEVGLI